MPVIEGGAGSEFPVVFRMCGWQAAEKHSHCKKFATCYLGVCMGMVKEGLDLGWNDL